ncbi:hypothetical protein ACJ41O_010342 [Fusarium nematophilum]
MAPISNPAIPKGSTVVVTGANGFIGTHIVDQFLHHGYKVRGTVRNAEKSAWLPKLYEKYGQGSFELVVIPDLEAEGAFDDVVKGASAVVHSATVASFDPDPNKVIPSTIAFAINTLKAAYKEPSVKRYILTSSSAATVLSQRGALGIVVDGDTWNEEAVKAAWAEPPYNAERAIFVYAASKTQSEQEVWKYHKEHRSSRPDLVVNTILPNLTSGKILDLANQGHPSTSGWIAQLFAGSLTPIHTTFGPQYFIDVQDVGRLHVASAILPDVKEERIFASAERFSMDKILGIFRKNFPGRKFLDDFNGGDDPNEIKLQARAEAILRNLGRQGWVPLEDSMLATVADLV